MADDLEKGLGNSNQKKVSVKLSDMKPGRPSLGSERRGSRKPDDPSSSSSRRRSSRSSSPPIVDSARPSLSVFRFKQALSNSGTGQTGTSTPSRGGSDFRPTNSSPSATPSAEGQIGSTASAASPNRGIQLLLKAASTSTTEFLAKRRQTESASTSTPESKRRRPSALGAVPPPPPPPGRRPGVGTEDGGSVVLSWTNLKVTSRDGKKILLDNLNGQVHAGFTAIMGPSGSGKSTLLNTLACRMEKSASVSGQIRLNGKEYTSTDLKKMSGYVMQDDLLNAHLTVEETLLYTVKLKLEPTYTEAQLLERVSEVIKQMGLEHCKKTVIGSALRRGISGGERKRVAVGMELLTRPQLLFLDEPTSGLDSVTALSLCSLLRKIAEERQCTVVCTIHQPQAKIFNLFQSLIILKAGKLIYQGSASGVLKFFEDSGFPCPEFTNPADHLLDVITPALSSDKPMMQANEDKLRSHFVASPVCFTPRFDFFRNVTPTHDPDLDEAESS
ncbi:hypothetical protein Mapa_000062 [Marchantia paleacea]|nr:hypothetical protein Mapa_000062 [Marchantia paleacea]